MLCSFALYSQCWEVVVYQEMICILAVGQKYGTCNYVRERQNLLTRKPKAIKVSGCVLIKLLYGWAFCLKLHREFSGKKTHTLLNLQCSIAKVQKLWVTSTFPLSDWPAWGFTSWEESCTFAPAMHKPAWILWCCSEANKLPYRQAASQMRLHPLLGQGFLHLWSSTPHFPPRPAAPDGLLQWGAPSAGSVGWPEGWLLCPRELEWRGRGWRVLGFLHSSSP